MTDIDPTLPLYIQIKERLREQIEQGVYAFGERLPSERELAQTYNVSRMTARQALQLLAQDGFTQSRIGKGTYVRKRSHIAQELRALTSFSEEIRQRGMTPGSRVLRAEIIPAPAEIAGQLKIESGAEIVILSRVRCADDLPLALEICHINHQLCRGILNRHDFNHASLYQALRSDYGLRLTRAEQSIGARMAEPDEAAALQLEGEIPVLSFTRVTFTADDHPVEFVRSVYRGDQYQLRVMLRYDNA